MKREIKFRVWTGQEMEYKVLAGVLGAFYVPSLDENDSASISPFNTKYPDGVPIMQFTGLTDKNGKGIYEGDVLCAMSESLGNIEVYYDDGSFQCRHRLGRWGLLSRAFDFDMQKFYTPNVIGNIYENPELLNQ